MDENLSFESLFGELSTKLVNLTFESIDAAIQASLKALVEFFDPDRCHLGELFLDQAKVVVPYFYSRPGISLPQTTDAGEDYLSLVHEHIRDNRPSVFSSSAELPKHASQDRTVIDMIY